MENKYANCIKICQQCIIDCQNCLINMGGKDSMNDCPICCALCIDACLVCVKFLAANSSYAKEYCKLCADICTWCAQQCGEHDHEHCKICAQSCMLCAAECEKIAA